MSEGALLQAAIGGPILAGAVWLLLLWWPAMRWAAGGVLALAAHAAAWGVFWSAYQGSPAVWGTFQLDLLGATLLLAAELAILFAVVRADEDETRPELVVGLALSTSAIGGLAFTESLAAAAILLPIPTLAVGVAALASGRAGARGVIGLAAADVAALLGLLWIFDRTGTTTFAPATGLGVAALLAAAAVKSGAVPWVGTWRLVRSEAAPLSMAMRAQGLVLAALAGLEIARAEPFAGAAAVGAALVLVAGLGTLGARWPRQLLAGALGVSAGLVFVALGLGGAVGARAALLLLPVVLLAGGVALLLLRDVEDDVEDGDEPAEEEDEPEEVWPEGAWGWLGVLGMGVAVASRVGLPLAGGFPGAWLTLSLLGARSELTAGWIVATAATAVGLGTAAIAAVRLVRSATSWFVPTFLGALTSLALVYAGTQPIRLGIGWWVRVERELGIPEVLAAAGAPALPGVGGRDLLLAVAPAIVLTLLAVVLGRGVRGDAPTLTAAARERDLPRWTRPLTAAWDRASTAAVALRAGLVLAALLELAAVVIAIRVVSIAAGQGFL